MHVMNDQGRNTSEDTPTPEQQIGRLVRLLRQGRGWSQQDVAEKMRSYGYQWSQATVTRLESATRPIRLNEVVDLAALFGIPVSLFLESGDPGSEFDDLEALEREITSVTAERAALLTRLEEAKYLAMVHAEQESTTRAELARIGARLDTLLRWHPHGAEIRAERLQAMLNGERA
jgi:transcriptional regulator with XRE-family HTH domain